MTKRCYPSGPPDARIMIVGEAPGEHEIEKGYPFANPNGAGGMLNSILPPTIKREECYITNVTPFRPPQNKIDKWLKRSTKGVVTTSDEIQRGMLELEEQIDAVQPDTIIALGNSPMWALTGEWGITKWRGSMLDHYRTGTKVLPTYHPAAILRMYKWKWIAQHDLRTAGKLLGNPWPDPKYNFLVDPTYADAIECLNQILELLSKGQVKLAVDIETSQLDISCIGFAWSKKDAICIPFTRTGLNPNFFSEEEENIIVQRIKQILEHPNAIIVGQNFNYDRQYLARCWGIDSRLTRDTMTYHHTYFSQLPKGLDFLSSLYCEYHRYWKDESKTRSEVKADDITFWTYNCKDCVTTFEVDDNLVQLWERESNTYPLRFQMSLQDPIRRIALRGTKIDLERKKALSKQIRERMVANEEKFLEFTGGDRTIGVKSDKPWWNSPKQTGILFYDQCGLTPIYNKGSRTTDDEALKKLGKRDPLFRRITAWLRDYRSQAVYLSTFCEVRLDHDGRIRCQYKIDGTETFRFASSADAFGYGTNLQNFPKGAEAKHLPNLRTMFVPDDGHFFWDADLQQADAQIVAWESGAERLKAICKDPSLSLHNENCKLIFGKYPETEEEKNDPRGIRQKSKKGIHSLHYVGQDKTIARDLGITVKQAADFRDTYFGANPEIPAWHDAIQKMLAERGRITNQFGHFTYFFDRPEKALTEAVAWIPQSTVGITINHGLIELDSHSEEWGIEPLLQVHDSLAGQGRLDRKEEILSRLQGAMEVPIPYEDPLTIGVDVKHSDISWGDCK